MNSIAPRPAFTRTPDAGAPGAQATNQTQPDLDRYAALMSVLRSRTTARAFDRGFTMPKAHVDAVLDAAALAPSGANTQPWHYIVVTHQRTKRLIADAMTEDAAARPRNGAPGALHHVDYAAMGHAPAFIVVAVDPRMTWAFPGMMDGSELDQRYHAHAETILLQSVAASTMAAHLAATALGYATWWVSALGADTAKAVAAAELAIPADLRICDFLLFGPPLLPTSPRWKKPREQISSWSSFDMTGFKTVDDIDGWMRDVKRSLPLAISDGKKV